MSKLLPRGTVTLLLADVEGSTWLWETHPDDMGAAVARLDKAVSGVIAAHDGVRPVEQGEGDSFVLAFACASDAVAAALDLQRARLAPIRLRIGVHTGEVALRDEGNYAGPTINRTARLRDLAHGGQTVLSGVTESLVIDRLPDKAWLVDLGTHALRDLSRPERVMQLCHPELRIDFPPLRVANDDVAHGLPVHLTRFVGRGAQITEVHRLVTDNRLVTLTGAGGVGKTRLAAQLAAQIAGEFGRAWFVDLAPITDPDLVPVTVAGALGLHDQPGRSTTDTVLRFLGGRPALVVLDNCEHLLDATAALVLALVKACRGVRLLATCREPLRVEGEVSYRVPSLSLSDEAVEMFCYRAQRVRPDFRLTDDNSAAVTEICKRLDGLPLAIELAAARLRSMTLDEIIDGLRDRFALLTGGARTAAHRQQTLWASVDWSYTLLTEPERTLFRRLAVFVGCFFVDDAQAVACSGDVQRYQVLDEITLLVDKSLVMADDNSGRTCYRLCETMRHYALEKLSEAGEVDAVFARHRDYYTALAARVDNPGPSDYSHCLDQAETEIDNLRAAFVWNRENSDTEGALALASSLLRVWMTRGRIQEGRAWFDSILADENAREAEASQEVLHKANSLQGLAFALAYQGELSAARAAADAALEAAELGEYFAGMGYSALTTAALAAGDVQTAQHASEAAWRNLSLALPLSAAVQRAFNAQAALAGGDLSAARRWCDDAVQSMTGHHLAMALATRARIAVAEGKREEAERDAHKALACAAESGAHLDLPDVLECLAGLASDAGTHHAAARLFGAAEAIRQQIGSVRFAIYRSDYVQSVTALRDAMGEKDFDAAWAEGAALSIKETIAYAQRGHSWRKRPATGWESLTPTEIDVVRLVGEGLANKDIATRLFVSPRTVQTHLTHVYTKLGFTSRLQLAQAAARRT